MSSPKPWSAVELPNELLAIPGMLSGEEKQYLTWLTSSVYEGWGAIIDLGCWLGCSSVALAEGLRRTGRTVHVESYDLFDWEPSYMEQCYPAKLPQGADFLPLFERFATHHRKWISVHRADLTHYRWHGGPVEILFVDAAKSWELMSTILQTFGSQIVPGKTRIIWQDFRHFSTYWLPLTMDSRPDLWREVEAVETGWTVTFAARKEVLGPDGVKLPYTAHDFGTDLADRIFRDRIDKAHGEARAFYELGLKEIRAARSVPGRPDAEVTSI